MQNPQLELLDGSQSLFDSRSADEAADLLLLFVIALPSSGGCPHHPVSFEARLCVFVGSAAALASPLAQVWLQQPDNHRSSPAIFGVATTALSWKGCKTTPTYYQTYCSFTRVSAPEGRPFSCCIRTCLISSYLREICFTFGDC